MIDLDALSTIVPLLNEADPGWCIFSSAARLLAGEDVNPSDIDICMSEEGALRAEQLLEPYRLHVTQKESGRYRSRRSLYLISGTHIDLSGGLQKLCGSDWRPLIPQHIQTQGLLRYTTDF